MPSLFRTQDGSEWHPQQAIPLTMAGGTMVEGIWAGSVQAENLQFWLSKSGHDLAQTSEASAVAVRGETSGKPRWSDAPPGARLLFLLEPPRPRNDSQKPRMAKLVTTAATEQQVQRFGDSRFSLFGTLGCDGTIMAIPSIPPPDLPPDILASGELFFDPVVDAYKHGVDKTLLKENLRLTPGQRLEKLCAALRMVEGLKRAKFRNM